MEALLLGALVFCGDLAVPGNPVRFVALFLFAGAAYLFALRHFRQPDLRTLWSATIAFRLAVFAMPPGDDIWRYIWEGMIQWHGFNPYLLAPDAPELTPLRNEIWPRINHPDWPTIYPPGAEMFFAGMAAVSSSPYALKLVFTLADLGVIAVLGRILGGDLRRLAWYAWNPLVVWSFAGAGHYDSLFLLALAAALLMLQRGKHVRSSACLGLAIALKVVPLFVLPAWAIAMWRRGRRVWSLLPLVLAVAVPAALCLFYGGLSVVKKPLTDFAHVTRFNDLVWWAVEATVWPNESHRNERYVLAILAAVLVVTLLWRRDWSRAALWSLGAALVLSPALHPWYITWILPLACWRGAFGWCVLSLSVPVSLLVWEAGPFWSAWQMTWPLRLAVIMPPIIYLVLNERRRAAPKA